MDSTAPRSTRHSVATVVTLWDTGERTHLPVTTLSDSGCNVTAMRLSLALKVLRAQGRTMVPDRKGDHLLAAAGEPFIALGSAKLVCLADGHEVETLYTIYDDKLPYDVVWGTDFFQQMEASMNFGTMFLTFGPCRLRINEVMQRKDPATKLFLLTTVMLEAGEFRSLYAGPSGHEKLEGTGRIAGAAADRTVVTHDAIKVAEANGTVAIGLTNTGCTQGLS